MGVRSSGTALASLKDMDERDLEQWERELGVWRQRLARQPPGALRSALDHYRRPSGAATERSVAAAAVTATAL